MSQRYDLVCLSHLRWDFVFQRPQHLLTRAAREHRVFFFEEPIFSSACLQPRLEMRQPDPTITLWVAVPHLPEGALNVDDELSRMLDSLISERQIGPYLLWYYTPMMFSFAQHLQPIATVYDCMDQLSAFKGASPKMVENEKHLFQKADLVFTGGQSLYEAKRGHHPMVYAFPSSVDAVHFAQARKLRSNSKEGPSDQAQIPYPRVGFFGVIDERFDISLLDEVADLRPNIQFVMIGPVVKIDPGLLPKKHNIHYLGGKSYVDLPKYLAGWDAAMMPFAINESTEFISPTKTPEYLAAGCPVVSTAIRDVVRPYESLNLVHIASTPDEFAVAIDVALVEDDEARLTRVDDFLSHTSWDRTWQKMSDLIDSVVESHGSADARGSLPSPDMQQSRLSQPLKAASTGA